MCSQRTKTGIAVQEKDQQIVVIFIEWNMPQNIKEQTSVQQHAWASKIQRRGDHTQDYILYNCYMKFWIRKNFIYGDQSQNRTAWGEDWPGMGMMELSGAIKMFCLRTRYVGYTGTCICQNWILHSSVFHYI